jgi:hypothetical protein
LLSKRAGNTPRNPNAVKHANTTTNTILLAIFNPSLVVRYCVSLCSISNNDSEYVIELLATNCTELLIDKHLNFNVKIVSVTNGSAWICSCVAIFIEMLTQKI